MPALLRPKCGGLPARKSFLLVDGDFNLPDFTCWRGRGKRPTRHPRITGDGRLRHGLGRLRRFFSSGAGLEDSFNRARQTGHRGFDGA